MADVSYTNGIAKRDPLAIIDEIERVRARNNANWMDLVRLAFRVAPEEAADIVSRILAQDEEISALGEELAGGR